MSIVQSGAVVVAFTRIDAVLARVGAKAMGPTLLPARVDVAWYTGSCFVAIDPGGGGMLVVLASRSLESSRSGLLFARRQYL
jgi:hypothetical protein